MILDIILTPILFVFDWFLSLFPEIGIPQELITGLTDFFDVLATINRYLPVDEIFACIIIVFVLSNLTVIIYIGNWLVNKLLELIPFIG